MAKGVKAGQAYISISADLSDLRKGADSAKKVMAELKASVQALGKGNIGSALTLGVHSIGTAMSAVGNRLKSFGTGLSTFGRGVMTYGSKMMAFAGMGLAGVTYVTKRFIDLGDALNKMSARTGATVEWLSAMSFGAERSGATIEMLEQAIRKLNKAIAEAQNGNRTPYEVFRRLRIDPSSMEFKSMDAGAQFELVARRLNEVQSQAEKTRLAMALFEEGGVMLLPLLGDIDKLKNKAKELGIIMTKDQADAAAALLDAWTNVKYQLNAIFMSLGEAIAPALKQVAKMLSTWAIPIKNFLKQHRELFILMAKGLALILVIGGVLATIGAVIAGVGVTVKSIGSGLALIGVLFKGIGLAMGKVSSLALIALGSFGKLAVIAKLVLKALSFGFVMIVNPLNGARLAMYGIYLLTFKIISGMVSMAILLQKLPDKIGAIIGATKAWIVASFTAIKTAYSGFVGFFATMNKLLKSIKDAYMLLLFNLSAISAGTWAWLAGIVAVVAAVGYIIYKTNALGKLWQWLKGVWQDTCNYFSDKWSETTSAIGDSLGVIWDAVMLGNFRQAWSLLCKDMLVTWDIWTLEVSDTWDALCANLKNVWASLWYGGVKKTYEWVTNHILTGLEYIGGKFAYVWEWIAGSCKAAFQIVVLWFQNVLDDITTAIAKAMNRMQSYMPGTGYTSEDADRENAMLDRMTQQSKSRRESGFQSDIVDSDNRLRQIEAQTQDRLRQLNDDLRSKMDMYDSLVAQLKEQNDSELTAEMQRRRQDIERLKQEIARETADLRAQNEAMKQENAIQHEDYGRVWEDIEANTAETAKNTAQKEATADVSARAITMRWGGLDVFAHIIRGAMRRNGASVTVPAPTVQEQTQIGESVTVSGTDMTRMAELATGIGSLREALTAQVSAHGEYTKSMGEKMQRLLDKLTELTRNTRRYANNIEDMLTAR